MDQPISITAQMIGAVLVGDEVEKIGPAFHRLFPLSTDYHSQKAMQCRKSIVADCSPLVSCSKRSMRIVDDRCRGAHSRLPFTGRRATYRFYFTQCRRCARRPG